MAGVKKVLLLVGSPRNAASTSESLGSYLCDRLRDGGAEIDRYSVYLALRKEGGLEEMVAATDTADLVVLAFPLYVDSLPAAVIRLLEAIAEHRPGRAAGQRLAAICNCGFPEASQMVVALAICRRFAREAGFEWSGGLALGGGEAIHGRPLAEVGGMAKQVIQSLDLAAEALLRGERIPARASDLMAKPFVPAWLYRMIGQYGWRKEAKRYGTSGALKDRPYTTEEPVRTER